MPQWIDDAIRLRGFRRLFEGWGGYTRMYRRLYGAHLEMMIRRMTGETTTEKRTASNSAAKVVSSMSL